MAKKIKFKISEVKFTFIEIETDEEERKVDELNKEVERFKTNERRYKKKIVSLDALFDEFEYELPSNEMSILDKLILEEKNQTIHKAIMCLTNLQRKIIYEHFWNEKSLRQIAKDRGVSVQSISENYNSALEKLREILKKSNFFSK